MKTINFYKWQKENGLTRYGNYEVSIGLDFLKEWTDKKINEYGLQINPDFQRGHVWTKAQQKKFVEFLIKGGRTTPIFFNHPGWMNDFKGEFVLVDGLQRLTAILNFINNEFKIAGVFYEEFEELGSFIDIKINVNNLKTKKEVLRWYVEMNEGGTPHSKKEIEKVKEMMSNV